MSRLTRDGTDEPVLPNQNPQARTRTGKYSFFLSSWSRAGLQPYPVDPYFCFICDHTCTFLWVREPYLGCWSEEGGVVVNVLIYKNTGLNCCCGCIMGRSIYLLTDFGSKIASMVAEGRMKHSGGFLCPHEVSGSR